MGLAIGYLSVALVMLAVMIVYIVLGHLLIAGVAFTVGVAALLSAVGRLAAMRGEDPDQ